MNLPADVRARIRELMDDLDGEDRLHWVYSRRMATHPDDDAARRTLELIEGRQRRIREEIAWHEQYLASRRARFTEAEIAAAYLELWPAPSSGNRAPARPTQSAVADLLGIDGRDFGRELAEHHPGLWARLGTLRRRRYPV